ncbi:hypothetical protein QBC39DRAFT_374678 [Podospora conica]|nr:hypothetical protein QBC39DRAFT_374678 [Schizothecium conicum]
MMDAPALYAEVQADTDDYLLDLDADPGVEDFDFKLDGVYDNGAVDAFAETAEEADASAVQVLEIEVNDEEAHAAVATEEYPVAAEEGQNGGADASIEYQDEIGYEDDESALPDAANTTTEEASVLHPEQSGDTEQDVHQQNVTEPQEEEYDEQSYADENKAPDALDGPLQQEDATGQDDDNGGQHVVDSAQESAHQSEVDHGRTPASNTDDVENADSDASDSSTLDLDIVVHYNQGQYALVGDPTADPDTYFFSDENVLTWPLSHFLASIRTVISDEVSAGDELCIRVESLDFEFGEKSSKKFLDRSFFDIIKCFVGLAGNSRLAQDSSTLNLALMVRRDCEDHFCELLTEAGLAHDEGDEDVDASSGDEVHDDSLADADPEDHDVEPDTADAAAEGDDEAEGDGDEVGMYFTEAFEDMDDTMGDTFDLEMGMPGPSEQPGAEAGDEQNVEVHPGDDQQDGHDGADDPGHEERATADEPGDDDVDFSADLGGELGADPTNEESELAGDVPDQAEEAVNNDWYEEAETGAGEDVGVEEVNATNPAGATTEQGSTQNGNTPPFLSSTTPEHSTRQTTQSSWREADEDLIDYTDDDEPPLAVAHSASKRKPSPSAQDISPKRRKIEASRWAVASWSVEDSEAHGSSHATNSLSTSDTTLETSSQTLPQSAVNAGQPEEEEEDLYDYDDEDDFPTSPPPSSSPPQATTHVDFGFTLDAESGLSAALDESGDVGSALEVEQGQASMNNSHLVSNVPNGVGSVSNHTSRTSTVIGDDVETQGSSLLDSTFNDVPPSTESQGDQDEIDWENDGEENEDQAPLAQTQTQTTSSPSAKRTRTNEPESLDEEADYKRRRT